MNAFQWLLIFIGGGCGSVTRAALGVWFPPVAGSWPWNTWLANACGCLLAGLLFGSLRLGDSHMLTTRALWLVGFCGGFTTFSAFALELWLLGAQRPRLALAYGLASVGVTFVACGFGLWIGRALRQ